MYKSEYLREFETEFENILRCESGAHMGSIIEKTRGQPSRATVPLNTCLQCSFILSTNPHEWMDNSQRSTGVLIINLGILDLLLP
jgi:hypothetical protein